MNPAGKSGASNLFGPAGWIFAAVALAPACEYLMSPFWGASGSGSVVTGALAAGTLCMAVYSFRMEAIYRGGIAGFWLAALTAAAAVSAAAGPDPFAAFPVLSHLLLATLAFILASSLRPDERREFGGMLAGGMIFGGVIASIYALIQLSAVSELGSELAALPPLMRAAAKARLDQGRAFSFFVYPNVFAGYLLLGFPAALGRLLDAGRPGRERAVWGALSLLLGLGLLATGSLAAGGCLLAAVALTAWTAGRKALGYAPFALLAGVLIFGGALGVRGPSALTADAKAKGQHLLAAARSLEGPRRLLLGQGPGRYGAAVGSRLGESLRSRYAHNWLAETYVETGFLGLLALLALLASLFKRIAIPGPAAAREPDAWGLRVGWIAWLGHSLADIDYAIPVLIFPWWSAAGYLAALGDVPGKARVAMKIGIRTAARATMAAWPGVIFLSAAMFAVPFFSGTGAALVYGGFLAAAVAWIIWKSLTNAPDVLLEIRIDWPWLALLGLGAAWVAAGLIPAAAYGIILEGAGLLAIMLLARMACARGAIRAEILLRSAAALSVSVYALWGLIQAFGSGTAAQASFPSPNLFAGYLLAGFLLALGGLPGQRGVMRLALGAAATLAGAALVAARASGAMLAAGILAACILPFMFAGKRSHAAALAGAGIAAIGGIWISLSSVDAVSVSQRITMWHEGARLLRAAPAGVGPGAYAAAAEMVREASVTAAGVGRFSLRAQFAHNEPLQFGVEWGLPALGIMILGIFVLFARVQRQGLPGWWWLIAGLLLYGLMDYPLRVPACKLMAATAAGILTAGKIRVKGARRAGRSSGKSLMVPALAAAVGLLAGAAGIRPAAARWALEREHPDPKAALVAAGRAQTAMPLAAEPYLLRAQANWSFFESHQLSDPELEWRVRQPLELAYSLSGHDPEIGMTMGYFLLSTARSMVDPARIKRARATFLQAAVDAPTRPYPWFWAARTFMAERDWAKALEALAQARRREPFFLEALAEMGRVEEARGDRAAARRHYRSALVLRAKLSQRKGMNPYETALCRLDEEFIKGRLLDLGSGM